MRDEAQGENVVTLMRRSRNAETPFHALELLADFDTQSIADGMFALLEGTPGIATITDMDGTILYMNDCGKKTLGIDLREKSSDHRLQESTRDFLVQRAIPTAVRNGKWHGEMTMTDAHGRAIPVYQVIVYQRRSAAAGDGFLVTVGWDLRRQKQTEEILRHKATHDELTGLANRALIIDRLVHALEASVRNGTLTGVVFMDVDRFKELNDHFGHEVGNEILQQVAKRMLHCIRALDTAGRYGGDEFVIVLPELNEGAGFEEIVERIKEAFGQPFQVGKRSLALSVSVGVALYPCDGRDAQSLLHTADQQMYRHKRLRTKEAQHHGGACQNEIRRASGFTYDRGLRAG